MHRDAEHRLVMVFDGCHCCGVFHSETLLELGHSLHAAMLVAMEPDVVVFPAGHAVQVALPASLYDPVAHWLYEHEPVGQ